jgi:outer membrane immunogenic protein
MIASESVVMRADRIAGRTKRGRKVRIMRSVICALVVLGSMIGLAPNARADDFDVLRGSQPVGPATFTRWSGFYAGGQFGYSSANTDFSQATRSLSAFSLRELALENDDFVSTWPVLGKTDTSTTSWGGFAGFNSQWQDLILGLEVDYTRTSFTTVAPVSPISRVVSAGGNTYDVTSSGSASLHLIDYGSLRARAGWIYGTILPYGFAGIAVGRADYTRSSLVFGQENPASPPVVPCNTVTSPTCVDFSFANSDAKNSALMYGFSVGGGVDWALTPNLFVRGEFEYVRFAPVADILVSMMSARIGAGVKF